MRATRSFTGAWRWLVPIGASVASALTTSPGIFDGPEPNRPSFGQIAFGIRFDAVIPRLVVGWAVGTTRLCQCRGAQLAIWSQPSTSDGLRGDGPT